MSCLKIILFILFFLNMNPVNSQNIASHKWDNRILIVFTDDLNNAIYNKQIEEFQNHEDGLEARKLLVYQIIKDNYKIGLAETADWKKSTQDYYKTYKKTNAAFELLLVGLDGGTKLRETDFISCEGLFSIIDVMPMRQSELNNN